MGLGVRGVGGLVVQFQKTLHLDLHCLARRPTRIPRTFPVQFEIGVPHFTVPTLARKPCSRFHRLEPLRLLLPPPLPKPPLTPPPPPPPPDIAS